MKKRHRRKGVLVGLRDSGHKSPKKQKPETRWRRALRWTAMGLVVVAFAALLVVLVPAMFLPNIGSRDGEADVKVLEIVDKGLLPEDAVAAAVVIVERRLTRIPLTPEKRREVEPGTELHVEYTFFPRTKLVQIHEWSVVPGEPPADEPEDESPERQPPTP